MAIKVDHVMSKSLVTAHWTEELSSAFNRMRRLQVRHLPVVTDHGEIVGMISDRDFQRAMTFDENHDPSYYIKAEFEPNALVRDYMSQPVIAVSGGADLKSVANLMINKKISAVLVVNSKSKAMGIVTHEDLLRALVELLGSEDISVLDELNLIYSAPIKSVATTLGQAGI